jgi:hypothetical protein
MNGIVQKLRYITRSSKMTYGFSTKGVNLYIWSVAWTEGIGCILFWVGLPLWPEGYLLYFIVSGFKGVNWVGLVVLYIECGKGCELRGISFILLCVW